MALCVLKKRVMTTECTTVPNSPLNIKYRQGHVTIPAAPGKEPLYDRMGTYLPYPKSDFH